MNFRTMTPAELDARRKRGEQLLLIDVREEAEYEIARIEGAQLLPLSRFDEWAASLDAGVETVVMCHHGIRSAQVCAYLARAGFEKLHNLAGGIDRWSHDIDADVPRY